MNNPLFQYTDRFDQARLNQRDGDIYIRAVCIVSSLCAVVQGFIITQSEFLLMDDYFLNTMSSYDDKFLSQYIALFYTGEMLGALVSFIFSDNIGRRITLKYSAAAGVLALMWCSMTTSSANFLSARFFLGFVLGVMMSTSTVYISEVSEKHSRGQCIGYLPFNITVGGFVSAIVYLVFDGYPVGWRLSFLFPIIVLLFQSISISYFPDSPRWLLAKKTPGECLQSMKLLRRSNEVSIEFNEIYKALSSDARLSDNWNDLIYYSNKSIQIRLILGISLQLVQQLVGIQIITIFGFDILKDIGVHSIFLGLVLAILAGIMGSVMFLSNIEIMGRRFILMSGCVLMSLSWFGASLCAYYGGLEHGKAELYFSSYMLRFLFGAFLCLFSFSYAYSLGPLSWVIPAEIFPYRLRAKASSMTTTAHYASAILGSSLLNIWLQSGYSTASCLLAFSIIVLCLAIVVYFTIPETKGIMLERMEDLFYIDTTNANCFGCFPNVRINGILGFRTLATTHDLQNTSGGGSSMKRTLLLGGNNNNSNSIGHNTSLLDSEFGSYSHIEESPAGGGGNTCGLLFEPSSLHKYSNEMRESKFSYFQAEEEPLVSRFNLVAGNN